MNHNVYAVLTDRLLSNPDKPLIVTAKGGRLSRATVLSTSRRIAGFLRALGLEPGSRVVAQVPKSPEALMLYLACQQLGLVYVPLNPAYTDFEVEYFLSDSQPDLYVCAPEAHGRMASVAATCGVPHVETLGAAADGTLMSLARRSPEVSAVVRISPSDLAAILYTSGTTGRSKGAMLSHGNLASNCRALVDAWRYVEADHLLHALPLFHTHGLFVACNLTFATGASMTLFDRFEADSIIDAMSEATVLMGVPTFYGRLLDSPMLDQATAGHMRLFVSGSAPLRADVHQAFARRTGHAILERYGMTETNMITSNPYDGERRAGSVGPPLPGVEVRVTDRATGEPLESDTPGVLEVRGPNVFQGYWRNPEKTRSEFRDDGFFVTGDLGQIDADGYVTIIGRDRDLIISGGFNVYPREVEALLDEIPGVLESAVVGVAHGDLGEAVTAVVVRHDGARIDAPQIVALLRERLAPYKLPKHVVFSDALPRNTMGKVQKNQLREELGAAFE